MPTANEQRLADFAVILADPHGPAVDVTIGSTPLRAVRDLPALLPSDSEGLLVERQTLYLLRADIGFAPTTGQELVVDGGRWMVESCPPGDLVELHLKRYRT